MNSTLRNTLLFGLVAGLIVWTGFGQSWNLALQIVAMGLVSAIMALGVNLQWGYAGLFNVGIMGFVALGGLAAVLVGMPPTPGAWSAGGFGVLFALAMGAATIVATIFAMKRMQPGGLRNLTVLILMVGGFFLFRWLFDGPVGRIEDINPAETGYLGGLNVFRVEGERQYQLLMLWSWPLGGLLAAGAAWIIGKTALGLRSDYLAIATLGIAEIIIAMLKFEDWLTRGVKNVVGIPRPVPYEINLQNDPDFVARAESFGYTAVEASTLWVKILYVALFAVVLLILFWMSQTALNSPWGRMLRAIRDNEVSAEAMGKDVTARHLQVFILGSAICGIAGAMMTTLESGVNPGAYQPLRFTFLIWVMVIVGGSGNNLGAILGGFLVWFLWIQGELMGLWFMNLVTSGMAEGSALKEHLIDSVAHMRLMTIGAILLLVLRFSPRGLIPEK